MNPTTALQAVVLAHRAAPDVPVRDLASAAGVSRIAAARALADSYNHPHDTSDGLAVFPVKKSELVPAFDLAQEYQRHSKSESTLRAYDVGWKDFCSWCESHGQQPLPASPETVAAYIADCSNHLKVSSISQRLAAITEAHRAAGLEPPTSSGAVRNTLKGIRRALGVAQMQKTATLTGDVCAMVDAADTGMIGLRDRALILLGFASAFRRSEIVALDLADLQFTKEGLTVHQRRSKTDQTGEGRTIGIAYGSTPTHCPVRVLQEWLEQSAVTTGPVFRSVSRHGRVQPDRLSPVDVARCVKKLVQRAGLNPATYAGHSLRSGHATSAAASGASERSIMSQTGHRSVTMVRKYIRAATLFQENSSAKLGL